MILKDDNGKELPKKVQDRVNKFIDNLPKISWFNPKEDLKKSEVDKQINFTLKCFWIKAKIEYRKLESKKAYDYDYDYDYAYDYAYAYDSASAYAYAYDSAYDYDYAYDYAYASAYASASAYAFAYDSAYTSARASREILLEDNKKFKKKYPNWAFKQLFKLWEMWLYPVWVLKENKKFVIYANPKATDLFKD